jgi:hypothetical protein
VLVDPDQQRGAHGRQVVEVVDGEVHVGGLRPGGLLVPGLGGLNPWDLALTALLGVVYAGAVLVGGQVFGGIGAEPPSWAVAGATLAVAALFQPARRRIQQVVDQRFNRRRYDAARTIEAFSSRLRAEIDLDTLTAELLAVVNQTVEPTSASLWGLRPSRDRSVGPATRARQ